MSAMKHYLDVEFRTPFKQKKIYMYVKQFHFPAETVTPLFLLLFTEAIWLDFLPGVWEKKISPRRQ